MYYSHFLYFVAILFLSISSGVGYSIRLFPNSYWKALISAPIIFYAIVTLVTANLNFLGLYTGQFSHALIVINLIVSLILVTHKIRQLKNYDKKNTNKIIIAFAFSLTNALIILSPAILHNSFNLFNDHTSYNIISEYLQDKSYVQVADVKVEPWTDNVKRYQSYSLRMGSIFFTSTIRSFFGAPHTFYIYPATVAFSEFVFILSISFLCLVITPSVVFMIFSLILLTTSTSLNHQTLLLGFLPQMFGLSLSVMLLGQLIYSLRSDKVSKWTFIFNSFCLATLISTYQEIIPFVVIFVLIAIFINSLLTKKVPSALIVIIISYLSSIIISPKSFIMFIRGISLQSKAVVGWYQPTTFIQYYFELFGIDPNVQYNHYFLLVTSLCIFLLFAISINKKNESDQHNFVKFLLVIFLASILVYFNLTTDPFTNTQGNSWGIYKLVQWFYWIPLIFIAGKLETTWNQSRQYKLFIFILFIPLCMLFLQNWKHIRYNFSTNNVILAINSEIPPLSEYSKLYELAKQNKINPANIYISGQHPNVAQFPMSITKDKSIGVFFHPNDSQVHVREQKNFTPNSEYFNWIYFNNPQISTLAPMTKVAGFNIYPPAQPIVHFAEGFQWLGKDISFSDKQSTGTINILNNTLDSIYIQLTTSTDCQISFQSTFKVGQLFSSRTSKKQTIISIGPLPPGFYRESLSYTYNKDCNGTKLVTFSESKISLSSDRTRVNTK